MGRMLDALKRADTPHVEETKRPSAPPRIADDSAESGPSAAGAEEVHFIEVGPSKSMEASASVLACAPASTAPPRIEPRPVRLDEPRADLPAPRSVQFRALPAGGSRSRFAPELIAYHSPEQPAARQYREVLEAVLKASAADERGAALLFTSALPRGGATTTLLNLAVAAARQDRRRVVVVDANLRQPAVAERLGLPAAPGLREALAGAAALDEVVRATEQANLFALTAGVRDAVGVRFVAETMSSLLRHLRPRWPLVFVDGPRWDGRADVSALGAACDAVYLVVPETEADTPQTEALLQHIPRQGAHLAGCILVAGAASLT